MRIWDVLPALPEHIPAIAADMRAADVREVWASHRHRPAEALTYALGRSELAWTCTISGTPAFMWGVGRLGSMISVKGAPWLLGTNLFFKAHRQLHREFLRQCPAYVDMMQARFPRLENCVHVENRLSIRWLKWCGFTVDMDVPEMINGEEFFRFWKDAQVRAAAAEVRKISVAEAFARPEFSVLCREYAAESAIAGLPDPKEKLSAYQALEAGGNTAFCAYGAFLGGRLIGFIVLLTPVLPHYGIAVAVAESLFVGSAYRKSGAGMLLIRRAEQRAKELRSPGILLSSPTGGRLAVLLPRIGYRETNRVFFKEFAHE
jgi:GNAT superfamily N-acetyltransferase